MILTTERLRLEPASSRHRDVLLAMNGDPAVMRFIEGRPQTPEETDAWIRRQEDRWARHGRGWWTLFLAGTGEGIGASCVQHLEGDPEKEIEIGWRLLPGHWGRGYATEAARAMVDFAFETLRVPRLYAVADPDNAASERVMQRLGMRDVGRQRHYDIWCTTYLLERPEARRQGRPEG